MLGYVENGSNYTHVFSHQRLLYHKSYSTNIRSQLIRADRLWDRKFVIMKWVILHNQWVDFRTLSTTVQCQTSISIKNR